MNLIAPKATGKFIAADAALLSVLMAGCEENLPMCQPGDMRPALAGKWVIRHDVFALII